MNYDGTQGSSEISIIWPKQKMLCSLVTTTHTLCLIVRQLRVERLSSSNGDGGRDSRGYDGGNGEARSTTGRVTARHSRASA